MEEADRNDEADSLVEEAIKLVDSYGDRIGKDTADCVIWRLEHNNSCKRCKHELGCTKLASTLLILMQLKVHSRTVGFKDFSEFESTIYAGASRLDKILKSKNIDEIISIL